MYHYINANERKIITATPASGYAFSLAMQKYRQFKQWALELDKPHATPQVAALINVAFYAGEFNRLLTPMTVDDLMAEINEINETLNRYADRFQPKPEIN